MLQTANKGRIARDGCSRIFFVSCLKNHWTCWDIWTCCLFEGSTELPLSLSWNWSNLVSQLQIRKGEKNYLSNPVDRGQWSWLDTASKYPPGQTKLAQQEFFPLSNANLPLSSWNFSESTLKVTLLVCKHHYFYAVWWISLQLFGSRHLPFWGGWK